MYLQEKTLEVDFLKLKHGQHQQLLSELTTQSVFDYSLCVIVL
jgi:hypothetical protein